MIMLVVSSQFLFDGIFKSFLAVGCFTFLSENPDTVFFCLTPIFRRKRGFLVEVSGRVLESTFGSEQRSLPSGKLT